MHVRFKQSKGVKLNGTHRVQISVGKRAPCLPQPNDANSDAAESMVENAHRAAMVCLLTLGTFGASTFPQSLFHTCDVLCDVIGVVAEFMVRVSPGGCHYNPQSLFHTCDVLARDGVRQYRL
jgi:hypothetical protein